MEIPIHHQLVTLKLQPKDHQQNQQRELRSPLHFRLQRQVLVVYE
jgi:hypothetical protein